MRDHVKLQTSILLRRLAYEVGHAARSESADTIHNLRVAIRRLNNCLRLFGQFYPKHTAKRCRRRLENLRELAGAVRDSDITLDLLAAGGLSARTALAGRLRDERRKRFNRLAREVRLWNSSGFSRKWRGRLDL